MTTTKAPVPTTYNTAKYYYSPSLYTHVNLSEALAEAQDLARQGFFVVMEEWHEETRDISSLDVFYENDGEFEDEPYRIRDTDLVEFVLELHRISEYTDPENVEVFYSPVSFQTREEWKNSMKRNDLFVTLYETHEGEPFDGYWSIRSDDTFNLWRSWHTNVKVFYDPTV